MNSNSSQRFQVSIRVFLLCLTYPLLRGTSAKARNFQRFLLFAIAGIIKLNLGQLPAIERNIPNDHLQGS